MKEEKEAFIMHDFAHNINKQKIWRSRATELKRTNRTGMDHRKMYGIEEIQKSLKRKKPLRKNSAAIMCLIEPSLFLYG